MSIAHFFENTDLLIILSIILGVLFPYFGEFFKPLIPFFLVILMTLSTLEISNSHLNPKSQAKDVSFLLIISYLIQGILLIAISFFFVSSPDYLKGLIVLAATPVGIWTIAYAYMLKGNTELAAIGVIFSHILAIFILPLTIYFFFATYVDIFTVFYNVALLILVPLIFSRILKYKFKIEDFKFKRHIINLCMFFISYAIIALNYKVLTNPATLPYDVLLVLLIRAFVIGTLFYLIIRKFVEYERLVVYTFVSIFKNAGLAATITLLVFPIEAAIPIALAQVLGSFSVVYYPKLLSLGKAKQSQKKK